MMKVTNDFYRQFEELNNKLDSLLKENKDLRREFKQEKEDLKATIKEKDELIEKLLNEIDRLKNQINKDSSNSSKPPSTDTRKKEKSGANLYNSRKKTDKKIGGQKGHKGHKSNYSVNNYGLRAMELPEQVRIADNVNIKHGDKMIFIISTDEKEKLARLGFTDVETLLPVLIIIPYTIIFLINLLIVIILQMVILLIIYMIKLRKTY